MQAQLLHHTIESYIHQGCPRANPFWECTTNTLENTCFKNAVARNVNGWYLMCERRETNPFTIVHSHFIQHNFNINSALTIQPMPLGAVVANNIKPVVKCIYRNWLRAGMELPYDARAMCRGL